MTSGYDGYVPHNWHHIPQSEGQQQLIHGNPSMRGTPPSDLTAGAVVDRLRAVFGVRTDVELAEKLQLGKSAPSNWRARDAIPFEVCARVAMEHDVSLDWLIFGRGGPALGPDADTTASTGADLDHRRSPEAERIRHFVDSWDSTRPHAEVVWLEHQLRRAVPEYAEWSPAGQG